MIVYWRAIKKGQTQHCWREEGRIFITSACGLNKPRIKLLEPDEGARRCKNCERALKE